MTTQVSWNGPKVLKDVRVSLAKGLTAAALTYETHARLNVQSASVDRVDEDGNPVRQGRSKPGEFPATDTGDFRNRITSTVADENANRPAAAFGIFGGKKRPMHVQAGKGAAGYPLYLQTGTRPSQRTHHKSGKSFTHPGMAARPWATLTVKQASPKAGRVFLDTARKTFATRSAGDSKP
ncbi:MAG: hypothetical protein AAGB48_01910 [Planctomycetota bacterium]